MVYLSALDLSMLKTTEPLRDHHGVQDGLDYRRESLLEATPATIWVLYSDILYSVLAGVVDGDCLVGNFVVNKASRRVTL